MENIVRIIEIIYMLLIIIDYVKVFIDWYVDYRINQKEKENKKRRNSCKDKRR
ncbi:MAG: hypothetical protein J6S85_10440 [Methanobrevibacter sp.]|jgi:hypothetical protein|nr:hypothetical protein [Methanobrevibacter sp.]